MLPGLAFVSASYGLSVSIFTSRALKLRSRICFLIFFSSIISLFIVHDILENHNFPGQEAKSVVEITGRVLSDSKEIGGDLKIFTLEMLYTKDINSTRTSASGCLTIASQVDLYKGQLVSLAKSNITAQNSAIIFIDRKNIKIPIRNTT